MLESDVEQRGQLSLAVLEILNYVAATELAFDWVEDRPLTSGLIGELQRTLVQGTAGELSDAGGLRDRQVFIGPTEAPIANARFVPAPHGDQLKSAFEEWLTWVNRRRDRLDPAGVELVEEPAEQLLLTIEPVAQRTTNSDVLGEVIVQRAHAAAPGHRPAIARSAPRSTFA